MPQGHASLIMPRCDARGGQRKTDKYDPKTGARLPTAQTCLAAQPEERHFKIIDGKLVRE